MSMSGRDRVPRGIPDVPARFRRSVRLGLVLFTIATAAAFFVRL